MRRLARVITAPVRFLLALIGLVVGGAVGLVRLTLAVVMLPLRLIWVMVRLGLVVLLLPVRVVATTLRLTFRGVAVVLGTLVSVLGRTLVIATGVTIGFAVGYALLRGVKSLGAEGGSPAQV